jgi:hypothetical protein
MVLVNLTVAKSRQAQKPLLPGGQRRTLIVGGGSARPSPSRVVTHARAGSSLAKCAKKDRDTTRSEYDGTRGSARVRSVDGSIQFQSAGLNLVRLTPLWTRTAHVVPLRMVRCRFPKLRYG